MQIERDTMTQPTQEQNLATVRDITAALTSLQLTATPVATLTAIAKTCREDFLSALAACVSGKDADGTERQKLCYILECTSEATIARLRTIGCTLPVEELAYLARKIPKRFLSAVAAASDPANPSASEARAFLGRLVRNPPSAAARAATGAPPAPAPAEPAQASAPTANEAPVAEQAGQRQKAKEHRSVHVYGSKFALCFNAVAGQDGVPGIMVDAAVVTATARIYDWRNAVHLMLDAREVGAVLAVFRRWRKAVEFTAHGRMNEKAFSIERQDGHVYCKVSAKLDGGQGVRGVQIQPLDATKVALLFTEQLLLASPGLPPAEVLATVRAAHQEPIGAAA